MAERLAAEDVYWMEEPLHRGDYDGMTGAAPAGRHQRIAGGEMTREPYEFRELLAAGLPRRLPARLRLLDGHHRVAPLAVEVDAAGKIFTPHTWGNGIGVMANLHLTAGTVGTPFIEFPFDPPEWTTARRDFVLTETIEVDGDGWITLVRSTRVSASSSTKTLLERTLSHQATFV